MTREWAKKEGEGLRKCRLVTTVKHPDPDHLFTYHDGPPDTQRRKPLKGSYLVDTK